MRNLVAYLLLACAIASEVAATSLLPRTQGFTAPAPFAGVLIGYGLSGMLLSQVRSVATR